MELAPFSEMARTARTVARAHRVEVHQRLGVLTPDPDWWVESQPQRKAVSYLGIVAQARVPFPERLAAWRRLAEEIGSALD